MEAFTGIVSLSKSCPLLEGLQNGIILQGSSWQHWSESQMLMPFDLTIIYSVYSKSVPAFVQNDSGRGSSRQQCWSNRRLASETARVSTQRGVVKETRIETQHEAQCSCRICPQERFIMRLKASKNRVV